ncbi:MAG: response regulator [Parvularcula sp.]|jgi:two-component SAPR family response regulator|nr:response regulator [Parvularcula sp.]
MMNCQANATLPYPPDDEQKGRGDFCIMIVEDEAFQSLELIKTIERAGFETVGPFAHCAFALALLEEFVPDAALLDIHLRDEETSAPIADALAALGVPFAFLSGHSMEMTSRVKGHEDRNVYAKPWTEDNLIAIADRLTIQRDSFA